MGDVEPSRFLDKARQPRDAELAEVLGRTHRHWDALREHLAEEYGPVTEEWSYPGKNYGWSFRVKHKQRAILYMTPLAKHFRISTALGDKAVALARESRLPAALLYSIEGAKKYAEGRAARLEVRNLKDLAVARKLAKIKMGG